MRVKTNRSGENIYDRMSKVAARTREKFEEGGFIIVCDEKGRLATSFTVRRSEESVAVRIEFEVRSNNRISTVFPGTASKRSHCMRCVQGEGESWLAFAGRVVNRFLDDAEPEVRRRERERDNRARQQGEALRQRVSAAEGLMHTLGTYGLTARNRVEWVEAAASSEEGANAPIVRVVYDTHRGGYMIRGAYGPPAFVGLSEAQVAEVLRTVQGKGVK